MKKEVLTVQAAKNEFVKHFYRYIMKSLKQNGNEQYSECFKMEGSSIICNLPENFFTDYVIPTDTKIEIKFIAKKS